MRRNRVIIKRRMSEIQYAVISHFEIRECKRTFAWLRAQSRKPMVDFVLSKSSGTRFTNTTKCCLSFTGRSSSTCRAGQIPKTLADDSSAPVSKGIQFASRRLLSPLLSPVRLMQDTRCSRTCVRKDGGAFSLLWWKYEIKYEMY